MAGKGSNLTQCIRAVAAYAKEIEALCETLNDLLTQELGKVKLPCKIAGVMKEDCRTDASDWLYTDIVWSLPLAGKKARSNKHEAFLNYQISLLGDGMSFAGNDEPLLHVYLWEACPAFSDENAELYLGYPMDSEFYFSVADQRLITWGTPSNSWKREWAFSVRLFGLDSSQALLDRIVEPAIALLQGKSAKEALPDGWNGLVLYPDERVLRQGAVT